MAYDAFQYLDLSDVSRFIVHPHYSLVLAIWNTFQLFTLHLLISTSVPQKAKPALISPCIWDLTYSLADFQCLLSEGTLNRCCMKMANQCSFPKRRMIFVPIHLTILESFSPIWDQMGSGFLSVSLLVMFFAWTSSSAFCCLPLSSPTLFWRSSQPSREDLLAPRFLVSCYSYSQWLFLFC